MPSFSIRKRFLLPKESQISSYSATEMGKTVAKADWEVKKRSSVLNMIGLKHLLDIQSEKSNGDKAREV